MAEHIHEALKDRGIKVPKEHEEMLAQQWLAVDQLRATIDQSALKDYGIGLVHIPGGDRK
ncbi:MAG TPA: hypothetical protein VK947_09905 [Planococcus sp. (in: firmicutes)]|nr:hypothetical protein [Planococcus sp. (in: firmicutes)]